MQVITKVIRKKNTLKKICRHINFKSVCSMSKLQIHVINYVILNANCILIKRLQITIKHPALKINYKLLFFFKPEHDYFFHFIKFIHMIF